MSNETSERLASKVTVGVGAGIPRMFRNVRVEIDYGHCVVEIRDDASAQHLATAPLGSTLIEWETAAPARHHIGIAHALAETPATH